MYSMLLIKRPVRSMCRKAEGLPTELIPIGLRLEVILRSMDILSQ